MTLSLLTNGVSSDPLVFQKTLKIFLAIIIQFPDYLKKENGALFELFLKILESKNSSMKEKLQVVNSLADICKSKTLPDMFLNYDCDLDEGYHPSHRRKHLPAHDCCGCTSQPC